MNPLDLVAGRLAARYSERTLARATVLLFVGLLLTQGLMVWYFGSLGLSFREVSHGDDDRTVVVEEGDLATFRQHYDPEVEEGWCLFGSINRSHVRIDAVVHAAALSQRADRIEFTCVPETGRRVLDRRHANLVGVVHSHPSYNTSRLSRIDTMTWGRVTPVVEVMGIYTERDGVEFFTIRSLAHPLDERVVSENSTAHE